MDVACRYRTQSSAFAAKVAAVPPDAWTAPTPCSEWDVRALVRHVVETPAMFFSLVGERMAPCPGVDEDPAAAFACSSEQVQAALDDPARAGAEFDGYFGRSTFAEAIDRFVCFDLVVHGWDLARATGQDEHVDPDEVQRLWKATELFGDAIRTAFGPAVEAPPGADEQARLLAYLGRRP